MQEYKTLKDFLKIISLFNDLNKEEIGITDISKALKMSPSKVSRMLGTVENEGLVEKNAQTGKYRLGILLFELGIVYAYHHPLRKIIRPHIEQMAQEIGVTVSWAILKKNRVIVLDRIQNIPIDALAYRIGLNLPIHTTSVGKILMAHLNEDEQDDILQACNLVKATEASVIDPKEIKERLNQYRKQGFSTDEEETYKGVNCLAAPIKDAAGKVIAAVSLMDDASRTSREALFQHADYLMEKALFISRQLGFRNF